VISLSSIGQTWQQRDIPVITLDARKLFGGDGANADLYVAKPKAAGPTKPVANSTA
jgi:hypothetical protein